MIVFPIRLEGEKKYQQQKNTSNVLCTYFKYKPNKLGTGFSNFVFGPIGLCCHFLMSIKSGINAKRVRFPF